MGSKTDSKTEPEPQTESPVVLTCIDCGQQFPFPKGEREFFASRDFPPPKRCPVCRRYKKMANAGRGTNWGES